MTPASSRDIFSREDTNHWIRSSWMRMWRVNSSRLSAGDVRQGIGQLQLFRLQLVVVFPQHDGDFVNLAFQDAQLALAVVPHVQGVLPRRDAAQVVGQAFHLPVPPEGVPQADAAE